jgi:spore coat polysaccharide biosynthesis protein SpsF
MNIVCIIQARMGSSRLPGKVLQDICGETMLARVLRRTGRSRLIGKVVVATTESPADDPVVRESLDCGCEVFRGSEADVLDRYYQAARKFRAEAIVRVTSDCPLIDAQIIDKVVQAFLSEKPDYAANNFVRSYPLGLDNEIVTFAALERTWKEATQAYQRSHVTCYMEENPDKFRLLSVTGDRDYSQYRWTVDTGEDLDFVRVVYGRLREKGAYFSWQDLIGLLEAEPQLALINAHIKQKPIEQG